MSVKPVGIGILGYAHYMRSTFVWAIKECPSVKVLGIYNRGEERRKYAETDGYFATSNLDELLALPGLEAVVIGTANHAHKENVLKCAAAKKHIICEKPMALDLADVDKMVDATKKAGLITHVNYSYQFTENLRVFRKAIADYAGDVLHFWGKYSRGFGFWNQGARHGAVSDPAMSGGWTFHHHCHGLNDACTIVGSRAVKVYHTMQKSCNDAPSEEIVNSLIHFENGATAYIGDNLGIGHFCDRGVIGTRGDVRLLDQTVYVVTPGPTDPLERPGNLSPRMQTFSVPPESKPIVEIGNLFAQAIRGGKNELLSFEKVRDQYYILNAMKKSAETGQVVQIRY